jgi:multisubunit Na+/H+ antiporter MnhB subunit
MIAIGCILVAAASFGIMYWLFGYEPNRFIEIAMQVLSAVIWLCGIVLIFYLFGEIFDLNGCDVKNMLHGGGGECQ